MLLALLATGHGPCVLSDKVARCRLLARTRRWENAVPIHVFHLVCRRPCLRIFEPWRAALQARRRLDPPAPNPAICPDTSPRTPAFAPKPAQLPRGRAPASVR